MMDPGDEHDDDESDQRERTPTSPEEQGAIPTRTVGDHATPSARVPNGGDSWVTQPPTHLGGLPVWGRRDDPAMHFLVMASMLFSEGHRLLIEGMELHGGRVAWSEDARRDWHGRLRRIGHEIDSYLSGSLPPALP